MNNPKEHGEYIANTIISQLSQAYQYIDLEYAFLTDVDSAIVWLKVHHINLDDHEVTSCFQQDLFIRPHHN